MNAPSKMALLPFPIETPSPLIYVRGLYNIHVQLNKKTKLKIGPNVTKGAVTGFGVKRAQVEEK